MYWTELILPIALACALLSVPGFVLALACGVRGVDLVVKAPIFSVGIAGVSAVVCGLAGVRWSIGALVACTLVFALAAAAVSFVVRRRAGPERYDVPPWSVGAWGIGGAIVGGVLLATQVKTGLINPDAISQSYDNIFHLNAVRYITDTGDGSSLSLLSMTSADGSGGFYPAAWHDLVALVFSVFPGSIPAATNAMTFAVTAFAWPLSVIALALRLRPGSRVVAVGAGVLAAGFIGFPGIVLKWGVLYPNMLGLALLPAYMAIVLSAIRALEEESPRRWWPHIAQVLVGTAAVVLAHPNVAVSAGVILLPWLLGVAVSAVSRWRADRTTSVVRPVAVVVAAVIPIIVWLLLRPGAENATWPPVLPSGQGAGEFLTQGFNGNRAQWVVTALVVIGVWACLRARRQRWLVVSWIVTGFLWIMAVSGDEGPFRTLMTGPWYNDRFRLAAISVVPALMLAALGLEAIAQGLRTVRDRVDLPDLARRGTTVVAAVAALVVVIGATTSRSMEDAWGSVAHEFKESPDSLLITSDEQAVLDQVDRHVPDGDVIVVDPWEGSALAYALEDREVTSRHSLSDTPESYEVIVEGLDDPSRRSEVCAAVNRTGAHWYLHFDDTLDIGKDFRDQYPGLEDVVESGVVTPVYTSGPVGLYRISECDA